MNAKILAVATSAAVVGLIALIYWPINRAGFVWVDNIIFHDFAWLRSGDDWKTFIFHNFYDWTNYFRPLVVALFVAEVRVFDVTAGPMHLISLGLHLANTLLVGVLGQNLARARPATLKTVVLGGVAILLYGLHPALIEPVAFVSSQAELLVTFFTLLGLLVNAALRQPAVRAIAVAACFLLAAGAKESAAIFPLILALFDWMRLDTGASDTGTGRFAEVRQLWQRQWPVYLSVFTAGIVYLMLRHWALGGLAHVESSEHLLTWARLQTVCYTYLTYWRVIVWPMVGLGPLHFVDTRQFATASVASLATDAIVISILLGGLYGAWKRKPLGVLVMAATVALLPVLRIIPLDFDYSLYHERYAMQALAMICAMLPRVFARFELHTTQRRFTIFGSLLVVLWLVLAITNIRVTLPLWSNDTKLWQWALQTDPNSILAQNLLLTDYLKRDDRAHARELADLLLKEKPYCPMCMLNIANLALADNDLPRAKIALKQAQNTMKPPSQQRLLRAYILATGQLCELEGDTRCAADAYHDAIAMEPLEPQARMVFAMMLARAGQTAEARKLADTALSLFAPDIRAERQRQFESVLAVSASRTPPSSAPAH